MNLLNVTDTGLVMINVKPIYRALVLIMLFIIQEHIPGIGSYSFG